MSKPIRVVVVEDSAVQRAALVRSMRNGERIEVVGEAASVGEAVRLVAALTPDVVTMDLEIPGAADARQGGIAAIERIMAMQALPILVLSVHVSARSDTLAIDALAAGAVDVFPKPETWDEERASALRRRIAVLSRLSMVSRHTRRPPYRPQGRPGLSAPVVGLAASTGGPSALRVVVAGLAGLRAPILIVQHIHADFTESFAAWLADATGVHTRVPANGEQLHEGVAYVAPPDAHLRLGQSLTAELSPEPASAMIRPSGDELLFSLARRGGAGAVGCVLTGMGNDGAEGLLEIRRSGGTTFAQDAASSVVDGMPRAARELDAANEVLPVTELAAAVARAVEERLP